MQVLVITPGRKPNKVHVDDGSAQLGGLQGLVQGYVEAVHTHRLSMKRNVMLVDEDGHSKGKLRNLEAERISGYAGTIVGTAVVCGEYMGREGMEWGTVNE